jgi:hypothetical protein
VSSEGEATTNSALDGVAHLERQVGELTDRNDITRLVYRLGACLDDRRFDEMPSLLIEAATIRTPGGATTKSRRTSSIILANLVPRADTDCPLRADLACRIVSTERRARQEADLACRCPAATRRTFP